MFDQETILLNIAENMKRTATNSGYCCYLLALNTILLFFILYQI